MLKLIILGIGTMFLGFAISIYSSGLFFGQSWESSTFVAFSVLYLSAVVCIATSLILKELRKINTKNRND